MATDRIRALVALAVDQADSEEGRTAAVQACREIVKTGLLDHGPAAPSFPHAASWAPWDTATLSPEIQAIIRHAEEQRAAQAAVERAERAGRSTEGQQWFKRVCMRRSFCRACRSFIEEGEVHFSLGGIDRCLKCDEAAEAIAKANEAPEVQPKRPAKSPRAGRATKPATEGK